VNLNLLAPSPPPPQTAPFPARAKRLPSYPKEAPRQWLVPVGIALALEVFGIALGFFSPKDTLLELIAAGEIQSVQAAAPQPFEQEVILEDPTPPPPPTPDPEFIKPEEVAEAPHAPPSPPQPIQDATPPPPIDPPPPQPDPVPAPAPPQAVAAPVAPAATAPSENAAAADSQIPLAPSSIVVLGNKDFPKPPYPYEARLQHMEGTVAVQLEVVAGQLAGVEIASSSGHPLLDRSAVAWIRTHWKFPADVTRTLTQPIQFQLGG